MTTLSGPSPRNYVYIHAVVSRVYYIILFIRFCIGYVAYYINRLLSIIIPVYERYVYVDNDNTVTRT